MERLTDEQLTKHIILWLNANYPIGNEGIEDLANQILTSHRTEVKELLDEIKSWLEQQSWDTTRSTYLIPKLVMRAKLEQIKQRYE